VLYCALKSFSEFIVLKLSMRKEYSTPSLNIIAQ
jgi:hypothetical protein